jgi:DNA polymerase-3 subunit epsilon/exodeoxyribonuclease X
MTAALSHQADLVAVDLEGSGAQDHDDEAILEIAVVPMKDGQPDVARAFATLVNPGRPISARPWISPGISEYTLRNAPPLPRLAADLTTMIDSRWLVGHNLGVDWHILRRHLPGLVPAGLIDTLALARATGIGGARSLSALIHTTGLDETMRHAAPGSQPHRSLWDATATAYLPGRLIERRWPARPAEFADLRAICGVPVAKPAEDDQATLF